MALLKNCHFNEFLSVFVSVLCLELCSVNGIYSELRVERIYILTDVV